MHILMKCGPLSAAACLDAAVVTVKHLTPRCPAFAFPPGHRYNRIYVMVVGSFIWGFFAFCFGWANDLRTGTALWAFNGIGLALMIPSAQSLVADYYEEDTRGAAFGALQLTGEGPGSCCRQLLGCRLHP